MEDMNQSEVFTEQVEQKMIYKFLLMIEEEKQSGGSLDTLQEKLKPLAK